MIIFRNSTQGLIEETKCDDGVFHVYLDHLAKLESYWEMVNKYNNLKKEAEVQMTGISGRHRKEKN